MKKLISHVWTFPYSISKNKNVTSTFVVFEDAVTQEQANDVVESNGNYRNAFETLDMSPEEESSLLEAMRAQS